VLPGMERGVVGDREPEVTADVDYDAGRPEQLAGEEAEAVLGLLEIAQLVHETLGVEGPALPRARVPHIHSVEPGQPLLFGEGVTDLEVVAGEALVIGRRHLLPVGQALARARGVPDRAGAAPVLRRPHVPGAQR